MKNPHFNRFRILTLYFFSKPDITAKLTPLLSFLGVLIWYLQIPEILCCGYYQQGQQYWDCGLKKDALPGGRPDRL